MPSPYPPPACWSQDQATGVTHHVRDAQVDRGPRPPERHLPERRHHRARLSGAAALRTGARRHRDPGVVGPHRPHRGRHRAPGEGGLRGAGSRPVRRQCRPRQRRGVPHDAGPARGARRRAALRRRRPSAGDARGHLRDRRLGRLLHGRRLRPLPGRHRPAGPAPPSPSTASSRARPPTSPASRRRSSATTANATRPFPSTPSPRSATRSASSRASPRTSASTPPTTPSSTTAAPRSTSPSRRPWPGGARWTSCTRNWADRSGGTTVP